MAASDRCPNRSSTVPAPTGLAVDEAGGVYVAAAGEVGRLDLATRQYATLAGGLTTPSGPTVRDGVLYVPDFATGVVATIDPATGAVAAPLATGLRSPSAAASASDLPVFVAEAQGNAVVRIDPAGGSPAVFATVQGPLQLALDPTAFEGSEWTLLVATSEGIVRLDADGDVTDRTSLPPTTGIAVVRDPDADEGGAGGADAAAPIGQTTVLDDDGDSDSSSSLAVIVVIVALVAIIAVAATIFFARRARRGEREDDDLMSEPSHAVGVAPVPGDCADAEREVDRLRELRRHVRAQLGDAEARARRSAELASDARDRSMRALEVRTSMKTSRENAAPVPEAERLGTGEIAFSSDDGRRAFDEFRRREIDAKTLKQRLTDLGELTAIAQISDAGRRELRSDRSVPWVEERNAARAALAARDELRAHESDARESAAEVSELSARDTELAHELEAAERRLAECRGGQAQAPPPPPPPPPAG